MEMNTNMSKEDMLQRLAELLNMRENVMLSTRHVSEMGMKLIVEDSADEHDECAQIEFDALMDEYYEAVESRVSDMVAHSLYLYDKHFSREEIASMVEFYASPTGKRLIEMTPVLLNETIEYAEHVYREVVYEVFGDDE